MDQSKRAQAEQHPGGRRAMIAFLLYGAGFGLFGIVVIGDLLAADSFQIFLSNAIPICLAIVGFISAGLVWRGHLVQAGWLIIASTLIGTIGVAATTSGYWFILVALNLFFTGVFADLTLPRRQIPYAIGLGLLASVSLIIIEFFGLFHAMKGNPEQIRVATWIAAVLLVIYLYTIISRFPSYSLRTKLILVMISATILSGGVVAVALQVTTSRNLDQTLGTSFGGLAQTQALAVGDMIDRQVDLIGALSLDKNVFAYVNAANLVYQGSQEEIQKQLDRYDQEWQEAVTKETLDIPLIQSRVNWSPLSQQLRNYRDKFPDHVEIFVTDLHGGLVATTNVTSDYFQADEAWWQAAFNEGQGGTYIGNPEYDESSGEYAINLAFPIHDQESQEMVGVLRSTYRMSALSKILFGTQVVESGETDLVLPSAEFQAIHEGGLKMLDQETITGLRASEGKVYSELDYEGAPSLVAQVPVRSTSGNTAVDKLGWFVVLHQPVEVATASIAAQTRLSVLLVLAVIGVVSACAVLLSQFISGPIVRLAGVAEEVGSGNLAARATVETHDEIGALADSFNSMTNQLSNLVGTLEQRVAERTRGIELSADVSRRLSTLLDQAQLASEVVELVQTAFDYYHVHIYLFDDSKENLLMVGGTGEAGKTMLASGHKILKGRGLVGRACESGQVILVSDTSSDPNWLPNPLLPETRSEIAVPIMLGDEVLGALDVQEDEAEGLGQEDADLLLGIAGQVAIALRNARQYAIAEQQVEKEARISSIVAQIQNTHTIEDALQVAVRELGRALRAPQTQVKVRLGEDENGRKL